MSEEQRGEASPGGTPQHTTVELRALLDAAVDAIIVIDERGVIEQASASTARMFGCSAADLIGRDVSVLMPAPYRAEHDDYMTRYMDTGEARIIGIGREVRAQRFDGSIFPCELAVGEISSVQPKRFVGFIRDISAQREAEDRLRRSESELQLAQRLANLGNYVLHLDGSTADYFSPQLRSMFGLSPDAEAVGTEEYLRRWVHPADRATYEEALRTMQTSGLMDFEYRVVLADGSQRHLHHIAQTVRGPDGRSVRHVGTVHDITDRRRAELEARQLQDRLTHFSRISTMGEMAAGLAHEVNQPLTAIAAYAQACQRLVGSKSSVDPDVLAALQQIDVQALRAGAVIRRLRHLVRNREVTREWIVCARLLEDLQTLAEVDARAHDVRLRIESDAGLPPFEADPVQIQQVVLNLIRNAIDSIVGSASPLREVVLHARATDTDCIEFVVEDSGAGMSAETAEQLFNPFFTTKTSGTGLGLAISRTIIRAHGGRLWYSPREDGQGARFHFTLPLSPSSAAGDRN